MDLASPAVSGTSVYANGLKKLLKSGTVCNFIRLEAGAELKDRHHIIGYARGGRKLLLCYKEKGRQFTYNVTMRRVRATIVAVEKQ